MNTRPRVFVPYEPLKKSPGGDFGRAIDLRPAAEFGDLVFILPPFSAVPLDPEAMLPAIREQLRDFGPNDYLLPVGAPHVIGWCTAIAARASRTVTMLVWGRETGYTPIRADLRHWTPAEVEEGP